ncbi:Dabb family protein [Pelagibacterium halotolerans]|uniref:Dabb family protein n=1 Tax=Pelagibacterium halotolerans TaxID=531813 RepID=UPI00384E6093
MESMTAELLRIGAAAFTHTDYKPGTVRHIVLFRYRQDVDAETRAEVRQRFHALKSLSRRDGKPYIVALESGRQSSGEGADFGFEDAFLLTFKSQGDRNYYVGTPVVTDSAYYDPDHHAFKQFVGPLLAEKGALVFDYAPKLESICLPEVR